MRLGLWLRDAVAGGTPSRAAGGAARVDGGVSRTFRDEQDRANREITPPKRQPRSWQ